ncbi:MAG: hypothetical protein ACLRVE_02865 [Finegoldia magna]|uniref:hypothetical protein n=1 Tax=Finegoldia magna TaxID=1260 RepID=UPI0029078664|nr:hypothetical protein [Finegoldia magna]
MKTKSKIPLITIVVGAILTIVSFYMRKVAETSPDSQNFFVQVTFLLLPITSFIGVYFSYKSDNLKTLIINTLFLLSITSFMFI